jgi:hypothetical protein
MEKDMNMQDNELDALFRDNLENMEAEPSANLWAGIAAGLDKPEAKKRSPTPYYSIAATIIVLLTAGIIFMPKDEPKQDDNTIVKVKIQPAEKAVKTQPVVEVSEATPVVKTSKAEQIADVKQTSPKVNTISSTVKRSVEVKVDEPTPIVQQQQQAIAAVTPKVDNPNPVVPDVNVPLNPKNIQPETEPFKTNPVVMAQANSPKAETQQVQPEKKKKRGLGGLLNSLVAKIDKREDKLVEFDDNQKLTGINLGILKITTEND